MVCLSRPYPFKFFKCCLPQISFGPFLNALFHLKKGTKRKKTNDKANYKPITILPVLPKSFEQCLYEQINKNVDKILSKYQTGNWKDYSS